MYAAMLAAPVGDDVFSEDSTVTALENHLANRFEKEEAVFFPTGTIANLCGIMAHCDARGSEIIVGAKSHLCLYEQGNVSALAGVHSRQIRECQKTATLPVEEVVEAVRGDDVHYPRTSLVCIENTHNVMGGVPLSKSYVDALSSACSSLNVPVHIDGARIFNASVALDTPVSSLCSSASSVSVCLSKGLGAPLGSVLVGSKLIIDRARRARKACGGGMRQAGVVASAGLHALENNVERLVDDHSNAAAFAEALENAGYLITRTPRTNLVFFKIPSSAKIGAEDLGAFCEGEGVMVGGGYGTGTEFRAAFHLDVNEGMVVRAGEVLERALV